VLGGLSKRGNRYLRTLFVGGAQAVLQHPHNWPRYRFGHWLMAAAPRLHRNVLAAALANKLARIAWSVLYRERGYEAGIAVQMSQDRLSSRRFGYRVPTEVCGKDVTGWMNGRPAHWKPERKNGPLRSHR
jgi:hypothetical protein